MIPNALAGDVRLHYCVRVTQLGPTQWHYAVGVMDHTIPADGRCGVAPTREAAWALARDALSRLVRCGENLPGWPA